MSSFGFLNVSGIDGVGNGSGSGGSFPGGIDKSVQFNDGGLAFGGVSTFLYDKTSATLTVNKAKPVQIIDGSNSVGTAGQVLSSTGSGLQYVTPIPVAPGAPNTSVQFNQGGVFTGDSTFTFNDVNKRLTALGGVRTNTIFDVNGLAGSNFQVLTSNGVTSNWADVQNVNVQDAGGVNASFLIPFVDANGLVNLETDGGLLYNPSTNALSVSGNIAIGTTGPVTRLFSLSGTATNGVGGSWNDQWMMTGSSTATNSPGIGIGYNTAGGYGAITCIQPGSQFRDIRYTGLSQSWYYGSGPTLGMTLGSDGNLVVGRSASSLITISKGTGTTASSSFQGYLKVGGTEYGAAAGTRRMIGFGYNTGTNNQPAYIGYEERVTGGDSNGDLVFGTRTATIGDILPTERMRILANGNVGIGNSLPGFPLEVTGTVRATSLKANTILDTSNNAGTSGQLLSSTGTAIQWINNPTAVLPGGSFQSIQYNDGSGNFAGNGNLLYDPTGVGGIGRVKALGVMTIGNGNVTAPRLFVQSGVANFAVPLWNENWAVVGGGNGLANSPGVGIGYNNATNSGIIACIEPNIQYRPLIYNAESHDFKTTGTTAMTVTQTGGGVGLVQTPLLQATQLLDGTTSTGSNGSSLYATGTGIEWRIRDYAVSNPVIGPFGTALPISSTTPTYFFIPVRSGVYTVSLSATAFNSNGAVGTVQLWFKISSSTTWTLLGSTVYGLAGSNIRGTFPTLTQVITTTAAIQNQFYIRTANASTNIGDSANFFISELT